MGRDKGVYERFAKYYDFVYEGAVDYAGDVRYLEAVFRRFLRRKPKTVLDLGCGTGNHAVRLARRGYELTGLDISRAQLAVARRKARGSGLPLSFVEADMRSFDFGRTYDAVVCLFGGFGYLTRTPDVIRCFRAVRGHLAPDGLFAFEFWQSSGVGPPPHHTWVHRVERGTELIRLNESRFERRRRLLSIEFRFFVFKGRRLHDRFVETHTVRTYSVTEMRSLLRRGGLRMQASFEGVPGQKPGFRPVRNSSFRVFAVCRPVRP